MEFLDIIMEFLRSLLFHIVEFVWSLEILIQNLPPQCGLFIEFQYQIVEIPDSGVFLFNFNTIKWNSSGVLLVCKEY